MDFLKRVLEATMRKRLNEDEINGEYLDLEQVPPASGNPWGQHAEMVRQGLCKLACKRETKNRYSNLFPFDKDIVKLPDGDYINASWFKLNRFKYIATMAPMHPSSYDARFKHDVDGQDDETNTCPDFWKMIWHTDAKIVVMLCKLEMGFTGCSNYFPTVVGESHTHGKFKVSCENVKVDNEDFIEREMKLTSGSSSKFLTHLQFKTWPNYGVPEGPKAIADFVTHVRSCAVNSPPVSKEENPRLVVHCSGGIGRSGTFLTVFNAIDRLTENSVDGIADMLDTKGAVNLKDAVWYMRTTRHPWMVEGEHQYLMAYDIIIQLLKNIVAK